MKLRTFRLLILVLVCLAQLRAFTDTLYDLPTAIHSIDARIDLLSDPNTKTVDFSTYELVMDHAGKTFLAALIQAAERGVKVRGIIDNKITHAHPKLVNYLLEKGIELRFHNPIKLRWGDILNPYDAISRFNQRLHDKMLIINSNTLVLGDKNYGNKYYPQLRNLDPKAGYVKGREVVMAGDGVSSYLGYFEEMWLYYGSVTPEETKLGTLEPISDRLKNKFDSIFKPYAEWLEKRKHNLVDWRKNTYEYSSAEMIYGLPGSGDSTLDKIFEKIANAKPGSKVLIENGYLVLFHELKAAVRAAIKNNVEIIVNLNEESELKLMKLALEVDLEALVRLGVKVYLNRNTPTHAKMILLENANGQKEVIMTSANFDPRSHKINTESGFSINSAELFDFYWNQFNDSKGTKRFYQKAVTCESFYGNSMIPQKASKISKKFINFMRPQL